MRNLREGAKKMETVMSAAARVRREFRRGRPPKPGEALPLHRMVVWVRANGALANLRERMSAAKLNPEHVTAAIVYIETADPDKPQFALLESKQRTPDECRFDAFEDLGRDDVIAIGMIFDQYDEKTGQHITFPYQFTGLNERAIAVLRKAAEVQQMFTSLAKTVN
jgi:hypothetical protein